MNKENLIEISNVEEAQVTIYKESSYRWIILGLFGLLSICGGVIYGFYTSFTIMLPDLYDIPLVVVNMSFVIYMILFIPASFIMASFLLAKKGIHVCVLCSCIFYGICMWMRTLINYNVYFILIANVFSGLAQPLLVNGPAKVSSNWFKPRSRPLSTSILTICIPLGSAIGMAIPTLFFTSSDSPNDKIKGIYNASIFEAILFSAVFFIANIFFINKPKTPPSASAKDEVEKKQSILLGFKTLFKNGNFIIYSFAVTCIACVINSLGVNISGIINPFGFKSRDASYFGLGYIICGLIGSAVVGIYLNKTKRFKFVFLCISISGLVFYFLNLLSLNLQSFWMLEIAICLTGFSTLAGVSIRLEFGCELGYPVGESIISCYLIALSNLVGIPIILVGGEVLEGASKSTVNIYNIVIGCILACATILGFFVKEKLLRIEYDTRQTKIGIFDENTEENGEGEGMNTIGINKDD